MVARRPLAGWLLSARLHKIIVVVSGRLCLLRAKLAPGVPAGVYRALPRVLLTRRVLDCRGLVLFIQARCKVLELGIQLLEGGHHGLLLVLEGAHLACTELR